jgi:hypothetical protein
MTSSIDKLHDASLVAVNFDWQARTCSFNFSGAPHKLEPFTVTFYNVTELQIPASYPWGSSVSVLEFRDKGEGLYELAMQSGDTITVVAPNYSFKADASGAA